MRKSAYLLPRGSELLILDDWGTHSLYDQQRLDLLEIFEERYRRKSTLITAQLPVAKWTPLKTYPILRNRDSLRAVICTGCCDEGPGRIFRSRRTVRGAV
jgi:hypothetical protein